MNDEQREDERRLAQYIERHGLVSAMNDTKWREVVGAIRQVLAHHVVFRVRRVQDPLDLPLRRERSFPEHVPTFKAIEWLDVDPIIRSPSGVVDRGRGQDLTEQTLAALKAIPVPASAVDGYLRIWGYYRPGSPPHLL